MAQNTNNEPWIDDIAGKLDSYRETPRANMWSAIDGQLHGGVATRRRWCWIGTAAAALLCGILAASLLLGTAEPENSLIAQVGGDDLASPGKTGYTDAISMVDVSGGDVKASPTEHAVKSETTDNDDNTDNAGGDALASPGKTSNNDINDGPGDALVSPPEITGIAGLIDVPGDTKMSTPRPMQLRDSRMAVAVYTNASMGGSIGDAMRPVMQRGPSRYGASPRQAVGEKWQPSVPLTIGINVRYQFGPQKRLGIETGVAYTMLTQQRDILFSDGMMLRDKSVLHYIGIPVNASYTFLEVGKFSFYGSLGGKVDFAVSNDNDLTATSGPVVDHLGRGKKGVQWSANAAIGAEYHINDLAGVYVAPGVGYYFDEAGNRPTVFKKYPWAFQAEAGVRVRF